eukprot:10899-Heterococcus_DN1.PRE.1
MPCHAVMLLCPLAAAVGSPNAAPNAAAESCVALLLALPLLLLLLLPTLRLVGDASRAVAGRLRPRCDAPLEEPAPPTLRLVTGLALLLLLVLLFETLTALQLVFLVLLLPLLLVLLRAARDSALRSCAASRNGFLAKQKPLGSDAVTGSMSSK